MLKATTVLLTVIFINACSGTIYTTKISTIKNNEIVEGVPFYGYKSVEKKIVMDRIRHSKTGDITHSMYNRPGAANYCAPKIEVKTVTEPDYSKMYVIRYEPQFFETSKFSVTLENGMLQAVNSESTPGSKVAIDTLQGIASLREDVLDGITPIADSANEATFEVNSNTGAVSAPIKCSANE